MSGDQNSKVSNFFPLIPQDWLKNESFGGAIVQCFASILSDDTNLVGIAYKVVQSFCSIIPINTAVVFGNCADDELIPSFVNAEFSFADKQRIISLTQSNVVFKRGSYIFVMSPVEHGGEVDEKLVNQRADCIRGLLTSIFGHFAMLKLVFEHRYEFSDQTKLSFVSPVIENHLLPESWTAFSADTLSKNGAIIAAADVALRDRFQLSLGFVGRIANELDHVVRFSHVWIALEIAAGGHAKAKNFLNSLNGFSDEAKRFADMRNDLFHHGRRPVFEQEDERLLCACVLACNLSNFGISDPKFLAVVDEHLARRQSS